MLHWYYLLALCLVTFIAGLVPFYFKQIQQKHLALFLAFSGSFLLGITSLHLLPETFAEIGEKAGLFILIGFFLQLFLQRISHGVEHGHIYEHSSPGHIWPIFIGLLIHAFLEGIPLGFNYQQSTTMPSISLGVAVHKIPEALTLSTLLIMASQVRRMQWFLLILFSIMSPLAGLLASFYGTQFHAIASILKYLIPLVIGSFMHISTTILYESGTTHHQLTWKKLLSVFLGLGAALASLLLHEH